MMQTALSSPAAQRIPHLRWTALCAIAAPTLLAFNVSPSATFLNQALAVFGWGLFVLAGAMAVEGPDVKLRPTSGLAALLAALGVMAAAALGAHFVVDVPGPIVLSGVALLGACAVCAWLGAGLQSAGRDRAGFDAMALALTVAGVLGAGIGIVQVFFPGLADGGVIAASALEGRATGNLRQPNHLSSLLLWGVVAVAWMHEAGIVRRIVAWAAMGLMVFGIALSASRTGFVGVLLLAGWGALDTRLSRGTRLLLLAGPLVYGIGFGVGWLWAHDTQHVFGAAARITSEGDISSSRFAIWRDTLHLIARQPWWGVGWNNFNFAWTLTPSPHRPVAFFDHTHNLELQFAVELGVPLALLLVGLLGWALWRAFLATRQAPGLYGTQLRCAFMMVLLMAVHSQLEYPLWYAYFLLPTAFAWGLCLGWQPFAAVAVDDHEFATPWPRRVLGALGSVLLVGSVASVADYTRVVAVFAPPDDAGPLAERIESGRHSWFFGHHADYAAATTADRPGTAMPAFAVASHFLLDTRLMLAWAKAYAERGDIERARFLADRLREFKNEDSHAFFAACHEDNGKPRPFQCVPSKLPLDWHQFP